MKAHLDNTRAKLGRLAELGAKSDAAEQRILEAAEQRMATVQQAIARQQPGIEGADEAAQDRYLSLIQERGQLNIVIAKARATLKTE